MGAALPRPARWGSGYLRVVAAVRRRAERGELCCFCGGGFDWTLPHNHRGAFTAHHIERLVDGGEIVPDPRLMAPAHRGCNSRDGRTAQSSYRRGTRSLPRAGPDRHSRKW